MLLNDISSSYISLIGFSSFLIFLISSKIFIKNNFNFLLDKDFNKPQAFHINLIPRSGGIASIVSLVIFFVTFSNLFNYSTNSYLFFSITFFIIGFLDDAKINIRPIIRLVFMIVILFVGLAIFNIKITKTGFGFLNLLLENNYFSYFFCILCFLFIINGSNLIDGFNGLLIIHIIIINLILVFILSNYGNFELSLLIIGQLLIMFCFLLFNFPSSKMFMGDGGAYLFGAITSLNVINISNLYPEISPQFFITLLFYLFFEVFFSFIRKLKSGKSPLKPDSEHLHMIIYQYLLDIKKTNNPNPKTSLVINLFFIFSIIPPVFFRDDGVFCRIWFLVQIFIYILIYFKFYNFTKKLN